MWEFVDRRILFHNGKIYSPEGWKTWMIVNDEVIEKVGSGEVESGIHSIDLDGKIILPGLHDAHIHAYSLGRLSYRLKLFDSMSIEEMQNRLASYVTTYEGEWIIGHGWDQDQMKEGRYPSRYDLDAIVPDRPVLLYRACNHIAVVNSRALNIMGITADTADPEGGQIDRDAGGEPSGILRESGLGFASEFISHLDDDHRLDYYREGVQACVEAGLTAIHTNDGQAWNYYKQLADQGDLPIRVYLTLKFSDLDSEDYLPEFDETYDLLTCRRVKLFADGSLGAETAGLRYPYKGQDHTGILIDHPKVLAEKISRIHDLGYQLEVHAIGDRAAEIVMDGFEVAGIERDDRPIITHCQVLGEDLVHRMAQQGYIANIQPPFVPTDARWAEKRLDHPEQLKYAYAWKTLLDSEVIVSGGSDAPIESPDPFFGIYCAIHHPREDGSTWKEQECLSFEEAIKIYTTNAAYAVGQEDHLGKLEEGYLADFVIVDKPVDRDYSTLTQEPVFQVWVRGKRRYSR